MRFTILCGYCIDTVILIPVPGIYCIGWLKNASDVMKVMYVAIFYFLFGLQGELLAILLFLKIGSVARPNSVFKLPAFFKLIFILLFISINHGFHWIVFYFTYTTRAELEIFIHDHFPYHEFLLRYQFLWMATSNKLYISLSALNLCSTGLIIVMIVLCYILVLYELEMTKSYLSKNRYQEHKRYSDEIGNHGILIFPFFAILPLCWFVQFFVLEQTDVSIPVSICFLIFITTPIPAMLFFLWRNPLYRMNFQKKFCKFRNNHIRTIPVGAQTI
ncbi:Protein CBG12170 [Caenorhabditis briggsae]|uniref:Protein CBG12170 n=1 Tax=Caenorhabditis briggsae TaxID=6238 RepID=A8XEX1_CAEBR|nr:Protein CBG12170 [Caenorhabditis briggsae]CAP31193.1 Protein CBG12170 [Caenorhabditis briggsae]